MRYGTTTALCRASSAPSVGLGLGGLGRMRPLYVTPLDAGAGISPNTTMETEGQIEGEVLLAGDEK